MTNSILTMQARERRKFAEAGIPYPGDAAAPVAVVSLNPEDATQPVSSSPEPVASP